MTTAAHAVLVSCLGLEDDLPMLPHFLAHYQMLGIRPGDAHVIINAPDRDDPRISIARDTLAAFGHTPAEIWTAPYSSGAMWERRRDVQARVTRDADWVLNADMDELHEYPTSLTQMIRWCAANDVTCVQGAFIDRVARDGTLASVNGTPALTDQFPVKADVMIRLAGTDGLHNKYGTVKMMLHHADVLPSRGGHHPMKQGAHIRYALHRPLAEFSAITRPDFRFALPFRVHHFKWTDALLTGLRRRIANPDVSPAGQEYGLKLLAYFGANDGLDVGALDIETGVARSALPWQMQVAGLRRMSQLRRSLGRVRRRLNRRAG